MQPYDDGDFDFSYLDDLPFDELFNNNQTGDPHNRLPLDGNGDSSSGDGSSEDGDSSSGDGSSEDGDSSSEDGDSSSDEVLGDIDAAVICDSEDDGEGKNVTGTACGKRKRSSSESGHDASDDEDANDGELDDGQQGRPKGGNSEGGDSSSDESGSNDDNDAGSEEEGGDSSSDESGSNDDNDAGSEEEEGESNEEEADSEETQQARLQKDDGFDGRQGRPHNVISAYMQTGNMLSNYIQRLKFVEKKRHDDTDVYTAKQGYFFQTCSKCVHCQLELENCHCSLLYMLSNYVVILTDFKTNWCWGDMSIQTCMSNFQDEIHRNPDCRVVFMNGRWCAKYRDAYRGRTMYATNYYGSVKISFPDGATDNVVYKTEKNIPEEIVEESDDEIIQFQANQAAGTLSVPYLKEQTTIGFGDNTETTMMRRRAAPVRKNVDNWVHLAMRRGDAFTCYRKDYQDWLDHTGKEEPRLVQSTSPYLDYDHTIGMVPSVFDPRGAFHAIRCMLTLNRYFTCNDEKPAEHSQENGYLLHRSDPSLLPYDPALVVPQHRNDTDESYKLSENVFYGFDGVHNNDSVSRVRLAVCNALGGSRDLSKTLIDGEKYKDFLITLVSHTLRLDDNHRCPYCPEITEENNALLYRMVKPETKKLQFHRTHKPARAMKTFPGNSTNFGSICVQCMCTVLAQSKLLKQIVVRKQQQ